MSAPADALFAQLLEEFPRVRINLLPSMAPRLEAYWESEDRNTRISITAGLLADLQTQLRKHAQDTPALRQPAADSAAGTIASGSRPSRAAI